MQIESWSYESNSFGGTPFWNQLFHQIRFIEGINVLDPFTRDMDQIKLVFYQILTNISNFHHFQNHISQSNPIKNPTLPSERIYRIFFIFRTIFHNQIHRKNQHSRILFISFWKPAILTVKRRFFNLKST